MRTVLKILGGVLLVLVVAAGFWWGQYGTAFIYGQINPDSVALIEDARGPSPLDAAVA